MIVDDSADNLALLSLLLRQENYQVYTATSGAEALKLADSTNPDLIMLDIMMPGMNGYEVCGHLKEDEKLRAIPVIFTSALHDTEHKVKGFEAGCVDYVAKPFQPAEVLMRVATQIKVYRLSRTLEERNRELQRVNAELALAAHTDSLTNLNNRKAFSDKAADEIARFRRKGRAFSLVLADIDFFKQFNDTHGHACGDFVLREAARLLRSNIREQDFVARWGGEEFIFLLPETDAAGAAIFAEKIRTILADTIYEYEGLKLNVSMTFGVSDFSEHLSFEECLSRADEALYKGKIKGRNLVSVWHGNPSFLATANQK